MGRTPNPLRDLCRLDVCAHVGSDGASARSRFDSAARRFGSIRFDSAARRFDSIRFDSIRFDSIRFDSIRFDSIRFDSIRLDSIRRFEFGGGSSLSRSVLALRAPLACTTKLDRWIDGRRVHATCSRRSLAVAAHTGGGRSPLALSGPTGVVHAPRARSRGGGGGTRDRGENEEIKRRGKKPKTQDARKRLRDGVGRVGRHSTLHYITVHYITLPARRRRSSRSAQCIILHYSTLHYITCATASVE